VEWGTTVVAGESVSDALLGAVSQELLIAIRLELHTGVWASESIGEAPVQGERMVGQMLESTRFGKLPHEFLWRGLQALQYQAAIVDIAQNEHTVFVHRESIAAKLLMRNASPSLWDRQLIWMTCCKKHMAAFKHLSKKYSRALKRSREGSLHGS